MISICANCGYHVSKVNDEPEDRRYTHTNTRVAACNLPTDLDGWRKNAVVTMVKTTQEWSEYRSKIREDHA